MTAIFQSCTFILIEILATTFATTVTEFTSSPPNVSYVLQGNNITLEWKFTISSSDDPDFKYVVWEIDKAPNIRLFTVTKDGRAGVSPKLASKAPSFVGHVHWAGSITNLAAFTLSDVKLVHTTERFACRFFIKDHFVNTGSESVHIKLGVVPVVTAVSSQYCNESQQCTLQCSASGTPQPTIIWTRTGQTQEESNPIQSVQRSQAGSYTCTASNDVGQDNIQINLEINYKPENVKLKSDDGDNTVTKGDHVTLTCSSDAKPSATVYSFYHPTNKRSDSSSGTLELKPVTDSDHGLWSCQATNIVGSTKSSDLNLVVQVPPQLTQTPSDQTLSEGAVSFTFQCEASGRPVPTITWTKLPGQNLLPTGSTYTKNNVQRTDQGQYQCKASNSVGNDVTAQATLTVNYLDINSSLSSPSQVESWDGHVTELKCVAAGQPASFTFTWSGPITQTVNSQGGVSRLTFTPSQDSHYGEYKCQVQNAAGTKELKINLTQIKVPGAPVIVSLVPSVNSVNVKWNAPLDNGGRKVTKYTVERNTTTAEKWISYDTADLSLIITELNKSTNYRIRVSAWNVAGQGPESEVQNVTTLYEGPPESPIILSTQRIGNKLTLTWNEPSNGGFPITKYSVGYKQKNTNEDEQFKDVPGNKTFKTEVELFWGSINVVSVYAHNGKGKSTPGKNSTVEFTVDEKPAGKQENQNKGSELSEGILIGIIVLAVFLLVAVPLLFFLVWKKRRGDEQGSEEGLSMGPVHGPNDEGYSSVRGRGRRARPPPIGGEYADVNSNRPPPDSDYAAVNGAGPAPAAPDVQYAAPDMTKKKKKQKGAAPSAGGAGPSTGVPEYAAVDMTKKKKKKQKGAAPSADGAGPSNDVPEYAAVDMTKKKKKPKKKGELVYADLADLNPGHHAPNVVRHEETNYADIDYMRRPVVEKKEEPDYCNVEQRRRPKPDDDATYANVTKKV